MSQIKEGNILGDKIKMLISCAASKESGACSYLEKQGFPCP